MLKASQIFEKIMCIHPYLEQSHMILQIRILANLASVRAMNTPKSPSHPVKHHCSRGKKKKNKNYTLSFAFVKNYIPFLITLTFDLWHFLYYPDLSSNLWHDLANSGSLSSAIAVTLHEVGSLIMGLSWRGLMGWLNLLCLVWVVMDSPKMWWSI